MLRLSQHKPFARGGNRCCFVDPRSVNRCVKVRRPEFTLEDLRRKKGFPRNLKPLSSFDESLKEYAIMQSVDARLGERAYRILPRNFGFVETDMGSGLCSELIRNDDGKISRSVMQYVWENDVTPSLEDAIDRFQVDWVDLLIPTRDLLLHNMVVQCDSDQRVKRLVLIDGLGYSSVIPFGWWPSYYKIGRAQRKMMQFRKLLSDLVLVRKSGQLPNAFWLLQHDGTSQE